MNHVFQLGDIVRDKVSGFTGTITAITERLHEATDFTVCSKVEKDGDFRSATFNEGRIEKAE